MDSTNEDRVKLMLKKAYEEVKKNYYDPKIHGLDWDARYHEYEERVKNRIRWGRDLRRWPVCWMR